MTVILYKPYLFLGLTLYLRTNSGIKDQKMLANDGKNAVHKLHVDRQRKLK